MYYTLNEVKQKAPQRWHIEVAPHKSIHACLSVGVGGRAGRDRNKQNQHRSDRFHRHS